MSARADVPREDVLALGRTRPDVLVAHEAPSTHRRGFIGIDDAAALCRSALVVHGHHHFPKDVWVFGLAKAEVLRLHKADLG